MIRVVVLLAVFALAPLAATAEDASARKPSGRSVSDAYYQKRQQRRSAAVDRTNSPGDDVDADNLSAADSVATKASAAGPSLTSEPTVTPLPAVTAAPSDGQRVSDPYYAQRHTAIARVPLSSRRAQYTPVSQPAAPPEEISPQPGDPAISEGNVDYSAGDGQGGDCETEFDPDISMSIGSRFLAATYAVPTSNVLWNELYSCRSMWVSMDYVGFWVKGNHVPPLVTTSPIGTPQPQAGVLGLPTTSILFGDQRLNNDLRSGARIAIGGWLVGDVLGIEGNYYALGTATTDFFAASNFSGGGTSDPILARPFYNPAPPVGPAAQSRDLIAYPGGTLNLDGSVNVREVSNIQSAGIMLRRLAAVDLCKDHRLFVLGGYRFFRLEEGLTITDQNTIVGAGIPAGSGFAHFDSFGTKNLFNGGDFGLLSDLRRGRLVLESTLKVALGDMYEVVNIDGQTKVNNGATIAGYPGGVLTQNSNIGKYRHNQFAVIPELNFKLGVQVTQGWRATIGYNFTYVSRVARPGNEVDMVVNPPASPGAAQVVARPMYLSNPTNLWLQGVTAGLEYHW